MKERQERLERMRAIEREFRIVKIAINRLHESLRTDPALLRAEQLKPADAGKASANLEATYLIRLFAEFEAGLRDAWENGFHQPTTPRTRELLEAVAARRLVPDEIRDNAQAVRVYRNSLVHEGGEDADPVTFDDARKYLGTFFSRLPLNW
jgi:hypothetical protein